MITSKAKNMTSRPKPTSLGSSWPRMIWDPINPKSSGSKRIHKPPSISATGFFSHPHRCKKKVSWKCDIKGAIELNLNHYHYTVPMYFVPLSLYSTHLLGHTPFYRLTPNQIDIKKPLIRSIF